MSRGQQAKVGPVRSATVGLPLLLLVPLVHALTIAALSLSKAQLHAQTAQLRLHTNNALLNYLWIDRCPVYHAPMIERISSGI